jgi:hypothetical protein
MTKMRAAFGLPRRTCLAIDAYLRSARRPAGRAPPNRTNKTAALSALGEGGETAQAKVVIWPWRLLTGRFEAVELSDGSDLRG